MKPLPILCLFIFSAVLVNGQTSKLQTALKPTNKCFEVTEKIYSVKNGFCSTSLHLNSDSTFTYEYGCELRSHVSIGKYSISNDSLFLFPLEKNEILPYCSAEESSTANNDSLITFIIKDKTGSPVNDIIMPVSKSIDLYEPVMHKNFVNRWNDSISINKFEIDSIAFPKLTLLTGNNYTFSLYEFPSIVKITLNLNSAAIRYENIVYVAAQIPKKWVIKNGIISSDNIELQLKK